LVSKASFGDLFNKLVDCLISELEANVRLNISEKLKRKDYDAFSFQSFKSSIKLVFLLKEYLNEATLLYKDLESYSNQSKVNKAICECLVERLNLSLKIVAIEPKKANNQM
jgi:hypothetical protein